MLYRMIDGFCLLCYNDLRKSIHILMKIKELWQGEINMADISKIDKNFQVEATIDK